MWAVRKTKADVGFELTRVPIPVPGRGEVLIQVLAASLCGTDVHVYDWDPPFCEGRLTPSVTTGHEVCGKVIQVGSGVSELVIGDLISAESHIPCKSQKDRGGKLCLMCKTNNEHICEFVKFFSVDVDGFLAEYAVAPANILWKNPPTMSWGIASLQESLGNSVYTVEVSDVKGKSVAVFGLGPTGLNSIAVAKAMGASNVIAVGGTDAHRTLAERMGATHVVNRHNVKSVPDEIRRLNGGYGVDVCLEMSGNGNALNQCLDVVITTGIVSILGLYSTPLTIDVSKKIVLKDVTIRGVYGRRIWKTWELTSSLLTNGMDISPVLTHSFEGLHEWETGIKLMKAGNCGKVVFYPHGKNGDKNATLTSKL